MRQRVVALALVVFGLTGSSSAVAAQGAGLVVLPEVIDTAGAAGKAVLLVQARNPPDSPVLQLRGIGLSQQVSVGQAELSRGHWLELDLSEDVVSFVVALADGSGAVVAARSVVIRRSQTTMEAMADRTLTSVIGVLFALVGFSGKTALDGVRRWKDARTLLLASSMKHLDVLNSARRSKRRPAEFPYCAPDGVLGLPSYRRGQAVGYLERLNKLAKDFPSSESQAAAWDAWDKEFGEVRAESLRGTPFRLWPL